MVSFLRKLTELKDPQGWVHHVADAATGKLLTTQLDRPVAKTLGLSIPESFLLLADEVIE
jgi:hypothetical protein